MPKQIETLNTRAPGRREVMRGLVGAVPALAFLARSRGAVARDHSHRCQSCERRNCFQALTCYKYAGSKICVPGDAITCHGEPAVACGATGDSNANRPYTRCVGGQTKCCATAKLTGCQPANALCGGSSAASI